MYKLLYDLLHHHPQAGFNIKSTATFILFLFFLSIIYILNVWVLNIFTHAHSKKSCFSSLFIVVLWLWLWELAKRFLEITIKYNNSIAKARFIIIFNIVLFSVLNIQLKHHTQYMDMKRNWNQNTRHSEHNNKTTTNLEDA